MTDNPHRRGPRSSKRLVLGFSGLLIGATCQAASGPAVEPGRSATAGALVEAVAEQLSVEYGQQQVQRLASKEDRDSLITAALLGSRNRDPSAAGQTTLLIQQLIKSNTKDPLALYVAALICQTQTQTCTHPEYREQLLKLEPRNAINFLLLPNSASPSAEQLHAAAMAGKADSHLNSLLGIVRSALADQPAPAGTARSVDEAELALVLRRNAMADVPWPRIGPTMGLCNADVAGQPGQARLHQDCSKLGVALLADEGHSLVTRMFGGTLLRRFAKGSTAAAEALEMRRQYVWMSELPEQQSSAEQEKFHEEAAMFGEWEALQRQAERAGVARTPAADWVPKNPEFLLLPEEREPPVAVKKP